MLEASLAAMFFGTAYVATGLALRSFSPLTVGAWRAAIGGVGLAIVVVLVQRRSGFPERSRAIRFVILGLLNGPLFLVAMNVAIALAGATIAAFVSGLYAIFAALFAPFVLREPLGLRAIAGFVIALVGTALLAELRADERTLLGVGVGFVAAVSFALFLVLSRRWGRSHEVKGAPVALTTSLMAIGVLFPLALVGESRTVLPPSPDPVALVALLWMGFGPSFLAQLLVLDSVRRVAARSSSAFLLLNPPPAAIGAFLLLGEALAPLQILGAALVLLGIAVATMPLPERLARGAAPAPGDDPLAL
jgi:probable blue pigment (indigoidine) exporter